MKALMDLSTSAPLSSPGMVLPLAEGRTGPRPSKPRPNPQHPTPEKVQGEVSLIL